MTDNDKAGRAWAAASNFSPSQIKLSQAIGEVLDLLKMHSAEAIPVFEWWAEWERSQEQR